MRALLLWLGWVALAGLLARRLLQDKQQPLLCDTTYLWQGYEEVPLGGGERYRLIKFKDGDPGRRAVYERLQQRHVVPVLFVHGHLGTHQQMRSAAAETGRELGRRLAANASWPLLLQWYATDFDAEASAVDAGLLDQQAGFVLQCITHLRRIHGTASNSSAELQQAAAPPFRLVLIAYSMGGVVARDVLRRLAADEAFDLRQVAALITLGSPHRFPLYMPHMPVAALLPSVAGIGSAAGAGPVAMPATTAAAAAAAAAVVPRVNIAAGAGDFLLPHTLVGPASVAPPAGAGPAELCLLMRDIPGVWTTATHKGIVSCNQLVRQLVPLLADVALTSVQQPEQQHGPGGTAQRQTTVQQLLRQRLATRTAAALGLSAADSSAEASSDPAPAACSSQLPEAVAGEPAESVTSALLVRRVAPGATLRLSWEARQLSSAGRRGLLLLVTAAPPCSHWALAATYGGGSTKQLAGAAAALPPLLPSLQQVWVPRHWHELSQGIDWQHNATRVLYVPLAGEARAAGRLARVNMAVTGSAGGGTTVVAQLLDAAPGTEQLQLATPGTPVGLPAGHAAALALRLPRQAWPLSSACGSRATRLWRLQCLAELLVGPTPPWRLRILEQQCSGAGDGSGSGGDHPSSSSCGQLHLVPALVGLQALAAAGDSVRLFGSGSSGGSGRGGGGAAVELWDGVEPVDHLLLISDPACAYSLRLEWDVAGWLGSTLRQLLFVLPTLCMAASQAQLSPLRGSTARVAAAAAVVAAWGALRPGAQAAATGGLQPWLRLPAAQALAALMLAAGTARLLAGLLAASLWLARCVLLASSRHHVLLLRWLGVLAVAAAGAVHPALAAVGGCVVLGARLATAAKQHLMLADASGRQQAVADAAGQPARPRSWLAFHSQLALLPCAGLYSWLLGGGRQAVLWTDGRVLATGLALHATLLPLQSRAGGSAASGKAPQRWTAALQLAAAVAVHEAAATAAAVCSLWGYPYITLYAAALSAAVDVVLLAVL